MGEDTQITWTADKAQSSGDGGTVYSMYNLANKRASNYGNCGPLKTGSCSSSKTAQTTSGSVTVADLNIVVADALNYGTTGPTSAGVSTIRDSINPINAQAAQRYIARISLDANLPGNGMGGSTKLATVDLPAGTTASADHLRRTFWHRRCRCWHLHQRTLRHWGWPWYRGQLNLLEATIKISQPN